MYIHDLPFLSGGTTVHSKLKVPINIEEDEIISELTKEGALKELIKKTKLMLIGNFFKIKII